jgi:hypothetical protein
MESPFVQEVLYHYRNYIMKHKQRSLLLPKLFYYTQPFWLYLYSVAFRHRSFPFTYAFLYLFYYSGKIADLLNKDKVATYSNEWSSYKTLKAINHGVFHLIFYMKLFWMGEISATTRWGVVLAMTGYQGVTYLRKAYLRRIEFIEHLQVQDQGQGQVIVYPSYYKLPILTSNPKQLEETVTKLQYAKSMYYYIYFMGLLHLWMLVVLGT